MQLTKEIDLEMKVMEYMKSGWKPIGGLAIYDDSHEECIWFHQAMIKDD